MCIKYSFLIKLEYNWYVAKMTVYLLFGYKNDSKNGKFVYFCTRNDNYKLH